MSLKFTYKMAPIDFSVYLPPNKELKITLGSVVIFRHKATEGAYGAGEMVRIRIEVYTPRGFEAV